ncbi:hypothetical protein SPONL_662 [uncultured Candidatus Thioglobus sp.]|nr:hypothetical protein SPONL_662 [uncultured Candidatus Thioglobus sp.]
MGNHNDQILNIFNSILKIDGRKFGQNSKEYYGLSDDAKGVQWNIAISKENRNTRLGVNLEGMKYQNWPIAKFIENEKNEMALCNINKIPKADKIIVGFYRDAWQCSSRPNINEYHIQETPLSQLNNNIYTSILNEAHSCLDAGKNYKGRAKQNVTRGGKLVEMEVSPHLNIYMYLPYNSSKSEMENIFTTLQPVYELVIKQSTQ